MTIKGNNGCNDSQIHKNNVLNVAQKIPVTK